MSRTTSPAPGRSAPASLEGKVAYVPGGTGGLGEAVARGLASAGARVVVSGSSEQKVVGLTEAMRSAGHDVRGVAFDARSVEDIRRSVDAVYDHFGACDLLVNCVGIHREERLLDVTEAVYDEVVAVNLKAAMFLGQAVARRQIATERGGKHVHLLSVRSQLGLRDKGYSAYASSKGGLLMLVKQHATELAPHGITVNGVAPTFVHTDMIRHVVEDSTFHQRVVARIPLGRLAEPQDIVGPVLFLCSGASDFVTGQVLFVDGGLTACQ